MNNLTHKTFASQSKLNFSIRKKSFSFLLLRINNSTSPSVFAFSNNVLVCRFVLYSFSH